jgi:hypothetical protein
VIAQSIDRIHGLCGRHGVVHKQRRSGIRQRSAIACVIRQANRSVSSKQLGFDILSSVLNIHSIPLPHHSGRFAPCRGAGKQASDNSLLRSHLEIAALNKW